MPISSTRKPSRWGPVTRGLIAPSQQHLWRNLEFALPLWEGAGTAYDLSRNRNDMVLPGGAATPSWRTSEIGRAMFFDGGDHLNLANPRNIPNGASGTSLSVLVWVNLSSSPGTGASAFRLVDTSENTGVNQTDTNWSLNLEGANEDIFFRTNGGNNGGFTTNLGTGTWAQVGVVWNVGTDIETYFNGKKVKTTAETDTSPNAIKQLALASEDGDTRFYHGLLGFVGIWSRGLGPAEWLHLYRAPWGLFTPWWYLAPAVLGAAAPTPATRRYSLSTLGVG